MRVLITGGAGFVGSHLVDRLIARGDEVTVIDNYATGRRDNLDLDAAGLTVVEETIADKHAVHSVFEAFQPEVVVHAAASYKDPDAWEEDARTNVAGTAILVQESQLVSVRRFIYFQTALCYGLHPLEQPITLSHPILPQASSYAITKTAGEYFVALSGLDWISFRLANAYGPRNVSGPLPTFFHRLTAGRPCFVMATRRDFVYVHDLVDVVERAVDGRGRSGAYHVSSGSDFAIRELYDAAVAALGIEPDTPVEERPRGEDDAYTILLDPSETQRDFGWSTSTSLLTGVAAAVAYYQQHGLEETYTHLRSARK